MFQPSKGVCKACNYVWIYLLSQCIDAKMSEIKFQLFRMIWFWEAWKYKVAKIKGNCYKNASWTSPKRDRRTTICKKNKPTASAKTTSSPGEQTGEAHHRKYLPRIAANRVIALNFLGEQNEGPLPPPPISLSHHKWISADHLASSLVMLREKKKPAIGCTWWGAFNEG